MKSDTNIIKFMGIFVLLSTFMNVVTMDITIGYSEEEYIEAESDADVYMRYGLTMWEMGTAARNYTNTLGWDEEEIESNLDALESIDESELTEMYAMIGMDLNAETVMNLFSFMEYVITSSSLYLLLPWLIVVVCVGMLAGTIASKHFVKVIMVLLMAASFVLILLPSKEFFAIMGVGPIIMAIGIIFSIISTIASFVSPGVIYVEE